MYSAVGLVDGKGTNKREGYIFKGWTLEKDGSNTTSSPTEKVYAKWEQSGESVPVYYYSENEPLNSGNYWHYNEDGEIVNAMIDPADGISKRALNNLVSYSKDYGCAEILLM